jgi:signal peptidase II
LTTVYGLAVNILILAAISTRPREATLFLPGICGMITLELGMIMKKQLMISGMLVTLDQLVKVAVSQYPVGQRITLIPDVLRFEPFQNTNLNWFASMAGIVMPVFIMVLLQLIVAVLLVLFYRYQKYQSVKENRWLNLGFCTALAGVGCSFVDVVFWNGSLDYVGFLNWFIFDMKDIFLNVGWISIILWFGSKDYKARNNQSISFKTWLRNVCKIH